jgi:hypothetical protein
VNAHCCCERGANAPRSPRSPGVRRLLGIIGWLLPSAGLVLMPKCPLCLAAWIGVATGIGLSVAEATHLRLGLFVVYAAALLFLMANRVRHWIAAR